MFCFVFLTTLNRQSCKIIPLKSRMKIKAGENGSNMGPLMLWGFLYRLEATACGHIKADRIYIQSHISPN